MASRFFCLLIYITKSNLDEGHPSPSSSAYVIVFQIIKNLHKKEELLDRITSVKESDF